MSSLTPNKSKRSTYRGFGAWLRRCRDAAGLTQDDVADVVGVSAEMIRLYEVGKNRPGSKRLGLLAEALGVGTGELADRLRPDDDGGSPINDQLDSHKMMSYPYLEAGPGAGASGVQWDEGERITVPTSVAAAWANGRRVDGSRAYWTRVQGSSMEPWLPDQSPIFVERSSEVVDGGRYVLWLDDVDAEIVKRIERLGGGYLRIISDNPNHATQLLRHVQDDVYEDEATQAKVRVRIRGRVLYPPDTPHAILKTVTEQMARMVGRSDGGLQGANH